MADPADAVWRLIDVDDYEDFLTWSPFAPDGDDAPDWLAIVDAAGERAAVAFDAALDGPLHDASDASRRRAARRFLGSLEADEEVPRATRRLAARVMPRTFERLSAQARAGKLGKALLDEEVRERLDQDGGASVVDPRRHPLLAYVDGLGQAAARSAIEQYRAALPAPALAAPAGYPSVIPEAQLTAATEKAREAWTGALVEKGIGDVFGLFESRVPDAAFWTLILSAAAGVLASFVLGPRDVLGAAATIGVSSLSADFDVAEVRGRMKIKIGGKVAWLPDAVGDGALWGPTLRTVLGAVDEVEGRVKLDFDEFDLGTRVTYQPRDGSWGVKVTFTLAAF